MPWTHPAPWSRSLNGLLSRVFTPVFRVPPGSVYAKLRPAYHDTLATLPHFLNKGKMRGVFYSALNADFFIDAHVNTRATTYWGVVHGPGATEDDYRRKLMIPVEKGICDGSSGAFVASDAVARNIGSSQTRVIGLPLYGSVGSPSLSPSILFNHRLDGGKRWERMLKLPEDIRRRLVVSAPEHRPEKIKRLAPEVDRIYSCPPPAKYRTILSSAGYVLSFSHREAFGYSVYEAVRRGAFALCSSSPRASHREYLPPEMIYEDEGEIAERIRFMDEHPEERVRLVRRAQETLDAFSTDRWVARLLGEMGVEA